MGGSSMLERGDEMRGRDLAEGRQPVRPMASARNNDVLARKRAGGALDCRAAIIVGASISPAVYDDPKVLRRTGRQCLGAVVE